MFDWEIFLLHNKKEKKHTHKFWKAKWLSTIDNKCPFKHFLTATFYVFQIQCFCFYHLMFFHRNKYNAFEKQIESNEKKEEVSLQNSAGGKYIYGPVNIIYARKKDVKCATTPSKWVIFIANLMKLVVPSNWVFFLKLIISSYLTCSCRALWRFHFKIYFYKNSL